MSPAQRDYTLEVWQHDPVARGHQRLCRSLDYTWVDLSEMQREMQQLRAEYPSPEYRIELHETWRTRVGGLRRERYDRGQS